MARKLTVIFADEAQRGERTNDLRRRKGGVYKGGEEKWRATWLGVVAAHSVLRGMSRREEERPVLMEEKVGPLSKKPMRNSPLRDDLYSSRKEKGFYGKKGGVDAVEKKRGGTGGKSSTRVADAKNNYVLPVSIERGKKENSLSKMSSSV